MGGHAGQGAADASGADLVTGAAQVLADFTRRYNFDLAEERPMESGQWEWLSISGN